MISTLALLSPAAGLSGPATVVPILAVSAGLLAVAVALFAAAACALTFMAARGAFTADIRAGKLPSKAKRTFHRMVWPVWIFMIVLIVAVATLKEQIFYGWLHLD
jgi:hypothetical protein